MRVKAAKRPGRPKKRDAERVRNLPVNYELGAKGAKTLCEHLGGITFCSGRNAEVFIWITW
jgi:hypothetical protein